MPNRTVTIQQAIRRGKATIGLPVRVMLLFTAVVTVLLLIAGHGWVSLLVLAGGILLMILYAAKKRTEWRLWAYENVTDIHQLQRSAELSTVLKLRSHDKTGLANAQQRERLKELTRRFDDEQIFDDDVSVPPETAVRPSSVFSDSQTLFTLNDDGIVIGESEFVPWSDVQNERIAFVSYSKTSARTGGERSAGGEAFFRFEYSLGRMEYSLSSLRIELWKLDLLLYIYRGRYEAKRKLS